MSEPSTRSGRHLHAGLVRALAAGVLGVVVLQLFDLAGVKVSGGWRLHLGGTLLPPPGDALVLLAWTGAGALAAWFFALAAHAGGLRPLENRASPRARALRVDPWVAGAVLTAFLAPVLVRLLVTRGAQITDDESAYLFQARLLGGGHLFAASPPDKLFFDRAFMINDGKFYSQYPLGWPALLAPFAALRAPGLANPALAAATAWLVSRICAERWGRGAGRVGAWLCALSPMLVLGAATLHAHTACLAALALCWWCLERARRPGAHWGWHAGVAAAFSLAFFVRPYSALMVGLPLLAVWAMSLLRAPGHSVRLRALVAFGGVALAGAALFLAAQRVQTGSWWKPAYVRLFEYVRENGMRFAHVAAIPHGQRVPNLSVGLPGLGQRGAAVLLGAVCRFAHDLFGWPLSLVFAFFAGLAGRVALPGAMVATSAALGFFLKDVGVDTYGPMHFTEVALPLVVASAGGVVAWERWRPGLGKAALVGLCGAATLGFWPLRLGALAEAAAASRAPLEAVHRARLHEAVVFVPAWHWCHGRVTHYRVWRPNNRPDLGDDVLWANHVGLEADRRFLRRHFPRRRGWLLWCEDPLDVHLVPLERLHEDPFPPEPSTEPAP